MHLVEPALTPADLATIANPALIMVGDDERSGSSTRSRCTAAWPTPNWRSCPRVARAARGKPALCNAMILEFLECRRQGSNLRTSD